VQPHRLNTMSCLAFMTCLQVRRNLLDLDVDQLSPAETRLRPLHGGASRPVRRYSGHARLGDRLYLAIGCASGAQISNILHRHH
jgi:hypothetical protein